MAKKIITSQFSVTSVDDGRDGENGENGTSPWVADFDNEMDSVQCDDSGYVLEEQTVYTNVRLFYGNNAKMLTIVSVKRGSVSMGNGTEKNGVTVTWGATSSSVGISFKYKTTAKISGKDNYEIVLRSYDGESQNKTLYFTVNGVRGDVYNLLPSVDEIHATRDANGNYFVNGGNTFVLTCGYSKRNLNGNVTRVADVSARIDNKYNIYFNRHKRTGEWAENWGLYQENKYCMAMPGTTIGSKKGTLNPAIHDAVRFALCESTSSKVAVSTGLTGVIDEETVCIVADGVDGADGKDGINGSDGTNGKDGKDGMGGVVATVTPDKVYAPCNCLGAVVKAVSQTLTFSLKAGATSVTVTSVTNNSKPTGVSVADVSGSANKKTLKVAVDAASSGFSAGAVFTVSGTYNGSTISAQCTVAIVAGWQGEDGTDGNDGHVGRWYEYKGAWGAGSVTSVTNTKHVGYFVKYVYNAPNYHYYINIKDDGVANTTTPADSTGKANSGWEQISDDRMAIFSKVIFSDNAYLGSFIINSDWMISQQAASGSPQSSYTKFNPSYPNSNYNNSNFIPVLAINGKTGKIYMNDAVVRGSITATSGSFTGTVYANNGYFKGGIYNPLLRINSGTITYYAEAPESGTYRITSLPSNCGGFQFEMTSKVFLYLPAPNSSWNGREFEIVNLTEYASADVVIQTSNAYGPALTLKQYFYVKFKVVYDPVAQEYKWIKISSMNVNRGLATGDTEDGAHVEFGNVVTT